MEKVSSNIEENIKVNFDYEYQLQGKSKPEIRKNLDYLFFISKDSQNKVLITDNIFCDDYINYLEEICGHKLNWKNNSVKSTYWWGNLEDLERKKFLNDKETVLKLNNENYQTITEFSQLEKLSEMSFCKSAFSFSGNGSCKLPKELKKAKYLLRKSKLLQMPYYNIQSEFGRIFTKRNGKLILLNSYQNTINKGIYRGSQVSNEISQKYQNLDQSYLEKLKTLPIKEGETFQIDGFEYLDKSNKIKVKDISEINFRKTMTVFLLGIMKKLNVKKCDFNNIQLEIFKNDDKYSTFSQKLLSYKHKNILFDGIEGVIPVSPIDSIFQVLIKIKKNT